MVAFCHTHSICNNYQRNLLFMKNILSYSIVALSFIALLFAGCCGTNLYTRQDYIRSEVTMVVTAYDAGPKSCGWEKKYGCIGPPVYAYGPNKGKPKEVGITSDGTKVKIGTIAADIRIYPYGTKMYVPGYGWGEVHDTGSAIKGNHIDVFFPDYDDALKWGKKYLKVLVLKPRK